MFVRRRMFVKMNIGMGMAMTVAGPVGMGVRVFVFGTVVVVMVLVLMLLVMAVIVSAGAGFAYRRRIGEQGVAIGIGELGRLEPEVRPPGVGPAARAEAGACGRLELREDVGDHGAAGLEAKAG